MMKMKRRRFISGSMSIVMLSAATAGCLPLVGLLLRGGLARSFIRGARLGGSAALNTLGRGVAVGARSASLARLGIPNTRIISSQGRTLGNANARGQDVNLTVENVQVLYSVRRGDNLLHYRQHGRLIGRSVEVSDTRIDYIDYIDNSESRRISSYDILFNGGRLVRHFTRDGDLWGQTEVIVNGDQANVVADNQTLTYLDSIYNDEVFRCESVRNNYEEFRYSQELCANGDAEACERVSALRLRYFESRERGC